MARRSRKTDSTMENQISLFDMIEDIQFEKLDPIRQPDYQIETKPFGLRVKEAVSEALKTSAYKRWEIAGRMSEYLGVEITEAMLNSWTAESKEGHRFPVEFLPALCLQTGDYSLLEILVAACGCRMVKSDEIYLLELGKIKQAQRSLSKKEMQLQKEWDRTRGVQKPR